MKKILSAVLAGIMAVISCPAFAAEEYQASDWAKEEVAKAAEADLIPDSLKDKDLRDKVTRAEFAGISVKLYEALSGEKAEITESNPFEDTDSEDVLKAYKVGITAGISEKEFAPDQLLSREQAATMLTRVYKKTAFADWSLEKDSEFELKYDAVEEFSDKDKISDWAYDSVCFMAAKGVINGVAEGVFDPLNNSSREQTLLMAVRMTTLLGEDNQQKEDTSNNLDNPDPYHEEQATPEKTTDEDTYTVAFIGGSLTAGGSLWISHTQKILQEKMPDKKVVTMNAGKGGTGSDYGAARFYEDVGQYKPDMVVIEFAVNDVGKDETNSKAYMESMIRQAKKLSKEPVIIFLYAPLPVEEGSEGYGKWLQGVTCKEEIAKHYGIKSINVYDYMQKDYNNIKKEKNYNSFTDYLKTMYTPSGSGFDVHGGYAKYAEAIEEAFTKDYEGCMSKPKNVGIKSDKSIAEATYKQIFVNSPAMNYTGAWSLYTKTNPFKGDGNTSIPANHYSYPFFTNGIKQVMNETAQFGFYTKASAFCLNYTASSAGSSAKVYIDGTESGSISCNSVYHGVNYMGNWITLPNDGQEHKVIVVVDNPTSDKYVFRFGSIIERYNK